MGEAIPVPQSMAKPTGLPQKVTFTEAQLQWLDQQFPEPVYTIGVDEKRFMVQAQQRGVVHEIRRRLAKANGG